MKNNILLEKLSLTKSLMTLFAISVMLQSCVSIDTTSYSDPDFIGKEYKNICVYSLEKDLNKRDMIEKVFVSNLKDGGYNAVKGSILFPPTREWSEADFQKRLKEYGYDGFLKIEIVDEKVDEYVNPQLHTETSTRVIKDEEGKKQGTITESNSYVTKDVDVYMSNKFQADLIDANTNKIAWKGFSSTNAKMYEFGMDLETIVDQFSESVIEELQLKGHLKVKE